MRTALLFLVMLTSCTDNSTAPDDRLDPGGCDTLRFQCAGYYCTTPRGASREDCVGAERCPEKVCVEGRWCRQRQHIY